MANKLLFRGNVHNLDATKTVTMPKWRQLLDQYQDEGGEGSGYTRSVWANRCINIRAALLAEIDWEIVKPRADGVEPVGNDHPLWELIREVNPETNSNDLWRATVADLLLYGTAYWEKIGGNERLPDFLQRLNPSTMEYKASSKGIEGFVQRLPQQKVRKFERQEIIYFHTYDPESDFGGIAAIDVCRKAIDGEVAANDYLADFFSNYAIPPILLSTEQTVPEAEATRIVRWWTKRFGGKGNRHKPAVVDRGLKAQILGYPIKDLALEEIRMQFRRDICTAMGVPMSLAGAWDSATYQSLPEQRQSIYTEVVIPEAEYLAGVINAELVKPFDAMYEFRWKYDDIQALQPDKNAEHERVRSDYISGIISLDAAIEEMGYAPEQVGEGRQIFPSVPLPEEDQGKAKTDLSAWHQKALRVMDKHGNARGCSFKSNAIDPALSSAIKGRLREAESADDINRIFSGAMNGATDDMNDYQFKALLDAIASTKTNGGGVTFQVAGMDYKPEVKIDLPPINFIDRREPPVINVDVPETKVEVKAADQPIVVNVPEPVVNVHVDAPEINMPKQVGSKRTIERNPLTNEVEEIREVIEYD